MNSAVAKINLLDLDLEGLTRFFMEWGEKPFRAQQVFKWIHQQGLEDFCGMSNLSEVLRERLAVHCEIRAPSIVQEHCSKDGTRKWLIRLADGNHIETVFIPEQSRGTLCVSSQVGCALNCRFCSTATQGFNRNLTVAEIIGQVWQAARHLKKKAIEYQDDGLMFRITNIVMMGMGEPLLNFEPVVTAMSIMRDDLAYALPRRRVTLSTSGVVPNIDRLSEASDVSLAVSLHAPNDELRNNLVPLNKKYSIAMLLDACRRFTAIKPNRHVVIEYAMLQGINDTVLHAKQLIEILAGIPCKINLIPFNPFPGTQYQCSTREAMDIFSKTLRNAGFITTQRKTRGEDIHAACGQLVGRVLDRTKRQAHFMAKEAAVTG